MPGEVLGGVLSSAIPVVGAGISAALERSWAKRDLAEQRAYNSPANQLRLLEEAGLPAAAYFSSGVSAQSDQPRATNVDPTLGTAEGVNNYFQNRLQRVQLEALSAEARSKKAQADIDEADRDWWLRGERSAAGDITNPRGTMLQSEQRKRLAEAATSEFLRDMRESDLSVRQQMNDAELLNIIRRNKILNQQFTTEEERLKFVRRLQAAMEEGDQSGTGSDFGFKTLFDIIYLSMINE